jgi:predicted dehydrogenase
MKSLNIGVIGYCSRASGVVNLMRQVHPEVRLAAITDVREAEIKAHLAADADAVRFYTDPDRMLDNERLDGVVIGTRCSLHTGLAVKALGRNLPLFLEKPVATNMADLMTLRDAGARSSSRVVVSFPLRMTPHVQLAREIIESGKVGDIEHVQAWNNVAYGWIYFQDWYRDENETQGLFLQKATHDFDYINYLVGARPTSVCAMIAKQIFKGDHPAGLKCDECAEQDECIESPFHLAFTRQEIPAGQPSGRKCAFAVDTGNEDSGSAIVRYETGMHASYSQNFFVRGKAGRRGARLFGYKGTIEFDWVTDELTVYMHHTPRVETHKLDTSNTSHGGGDMVLVDNFVRVMRGEQESISPLGDGLLSALMCLKAKESAATDTFQEIAWPDEEPESRHK